MIYCDNCGCRTYNGLCVNCDEESYIENQYYDLGEPAPTDLAEVARKQREGRDQRRREAV